MLEEIIWFTPKPIPVATTLNETWVIKEYKLEKANVSENTEVL